MTRYTPGLLSVLLAFVVVLSVVPPAWADAWYPYGRLICQDDRALISFTAAPNSNLPQFPPLPDDFSTFDAEPVDGNECTLADGREVRVKIGTRPMTPWGECGAALDTYASVWVDHRKIVSRLWVQRSCFFLDGAFSDLMVVDGDKLTFCATDQGLGDLRGRPPEGWCENESALLNAPIDRFEYPADGASAMVGGINIAFAGDRAFCASFLSDERDDTNGDDTLWAASDLGAINDPAFLTPSNYGKLEWEYQPSRPKGAAYFTWPSSITLVTFRRMVPDPSGEALPINPWSDPFAIAEVDFDNDGEIETVVQAYGRSGANYGDQFVIAKRAEVGHYVDVLAEIGTREIGTDRRAFERSVYGAVHRIPSRFADPFQVVDPSAEEGAALQSVFQYDGETLVLAAPTFIKPFRNKIMIYRPQPDGKAEPVCVFERHLENY